MSKLILIKHASPQQEDGVPSHEWRLSEVGREKAKALAEHIRAHAPELIVTSDEPKAIETGEIITAALGITSEIASDLHEHDRTNVPLMRTGEFISAMAQFFKERDQLVLGSETASDALARFDIALQRVLERHRDKTIAIVSHGTVLALFAAPHAAIDAFQLWRRMGLPSFLVLDTDGMKLLDIVERP